MTNPEPAESQGPDPLRPAASLDRLIEQLAPVAVFLLLFRTVNTTAGAVGSTVASIAVGVRRRRRGLPIGRLLPFVSAYLIGRAILTWLVESGRIDFRVSTEAVYFGLGILTKLLVGIFLLGSVIIGRPFLATAVPQVVSLPATVLKHQEFRATMVMATLVGAGFAIITSGTDVWLYNNADVVGFLVARSVLNYLVSVVAISATMIVVERRLKSVEGYPGMFALLDQATGRA